MLFHGGQRWIVIENLIEGVLLTYIFNLKVSLTLILKKGSNYAFLKGKAHWKKKKTLIVW